MGLPAPHAMPRAMDQQNGWKPSLGCIGISGFYPYTVMYFLPFHRSATSQAAMLSMPRELRSTGAGLERAISFFNRLRNSRSLTVIV